MPPRVLHVHATPGALGGSELTMLLAVKALRALGVENHLLYDAPEPPESAAFDGLLNDATAFRVRQNPGVTAQSYRRIARYVRHHQIDVIHARFCVALPLVRALIRIAPTVASAHLPICPNGSRFHYGTERPCEEPIGRACLTSGRSVYKCGFTSDLVPFGPLGLERGLVRAKAELHLLRACRLVMAPSEWQRQRLGDDGVPIERIVVVPSPIESGRQKPLATRPHPPIVVFAARLMRFKGAHHLLEAVALVEREIQVQIIGDGPELGALKDRVHRLGIADRVTFLGWLDSAALREHYAHATVVAVPSLWPETFNRIGPEALAVGTPVVAYTSGGVGEWLRPGVSGIAVPTGQISTLADAIRSVVSGGGLREVVRIHGPTVAAEFAVERHAEKVVACYEAALSGRGTS